jgi:phosphohistidine phosphatase SixA
MRPFRVLQRSAFSFLLAWCGGCLGAQDTTVVVLRHAERISLSDNASLLSEAGQERAKALAGQLETFHPAALYASDLERTRQTLAPLAARLGMPVLVHPRRDGAGLAAEILKTQRGKTVIICWHHDLAPGLAKSLGVEEPLPELAVEDFGWLWIIRVPATGRATLEARRQSAPAAAAVPQGR